MLTSRQSSPQKEKSCLPSVNCHSKLTFPSKPRCCSSSVDFSFSVIRRCRQLCCELCIGKPVSPYTTFIQILSFCIIRHLRSIFLKSPYFTSTLSELLIRNSVSYHDCISLGNSICFVVWLWVFFLYKRNSLRKAVFLIANISN